MTHKSQSPNFGSSAVLTFLIISMLVSQVCHCVAAYPGAFDLHGNALDEETRKEIISLARRIANKAQYSGSHVQSNRFTKKNGGTADTIYNLPDLMDIGRRR